jgi:membrane AbrB-like protein
MEKSDLRRLPMVIKPTAIMLGTFLFLNLSAGALIYATGPLDWATALMSGVPGGITDIPIVAADMGADTPKVAILQLARYMLGIVFFPSMILTYDNFRQKTEAKKESTTGGAVKRDESLRDKPLREKSNIASLPALACTLAVGLVAGFLGELTGIPAGTFLFSIVGVLVLKLKFDFAYISPAVKKIILLVSGCYIGSLITMDDVLGFRMLALPLLIILGGYIANCFITGKIISKTCGFTRKEGLLATTPAGASDMALTSVDIGVENTDIIIIQVCRAIVAAAVFPQIINVLLLFLPR